MAKARAFSGTRAPRVTRWATLAYAIGALSVATTLYFFAKP